MENGNTKNQEKKMSKNKAFYRSFTVSWMHNEDKTEKELQQEIEKSYDVAEYKEIIYMMAELLMRKTR